MNDDSAREIDAASDSGFRAKTTVAYGLRYRGHTVRLTKPETTLGRSAEADVVVASALASRHHALIRIVDQGAMIEDLASRNGVYVNSIRIEAPTLIGAGDKIAVGDATLELVELKQGAPDTHPTAVAMSAQAPLQQQYSQSFEDESATRRADAFQLLGGVVDKALAMGRGAEAERVLKSHLQNALRDAKKGISLAPELSRAAAHYAIQLGAATGKPSWIDYAFELYLAVQQMLPLALVEELYGVAHKVRGVDRALMRTYIAELKLNGDSWSPTERFVLQRIEGLERSPTL